jgi:hypothetical protein
MQFKGLSALFRLCNSPKPEEASKEVYTVKLNPKKII